MVIALNRAVLNASLRQSLPGTNNTEITLIEMYVLSILMPTLVFRAFNSYKCRSKSQKEYMQHYQAERLEKNECY